MNEDDVRPMTRTAATIVLRDTQGEYLSLQQIRLSPLASEGAEVVATSERIAIGSHERCDVVVKDATVSRWHCELVVRDGQVIVTDLGSSNGTTGRARRARVSARCGARHGPREVAVRCR